MDFAAQGTLSARVRRGWTRWIGAALALILLAPTAALAQAAVPELTLMVQPGAFSGKWVYRSFSNSPDPKESLAKIALGLTELTITESGGRVTAVRSAQGGGTAYDLAGVALYAPQEGATIRLHGTATIGGKTWNYDYFGYLIPVWSVGGGVPDTILGTVLRTDPANPANAPVIASFAATRQK